MLKNAVDTDTEYFVENRNRRGHRKQMPFASCIGGVTFDYNHDFKRRRTVGDGTVPLPVQILCIILFDVDLPGSPIILCLLLL